MKAKIRSRSGVPYGGAYTLDFPAKGLVGSSYHFDGLVGSVMAWRKANGWPIGLGFMDEVEQAVCAAYPNECDDVDPLVPPRDFTMTLDAVAQGTEFAFKNLFAGRPTATAEEALRRAKICAGCPMNRSVRGSCGAPCGALKAIVAATVGSKTTPLDGSLRSCAICRCWLGVAVWADLDLQRSVLTDRQKEQFAYAKEQWGCWKAG